MCVNGKRGNACFQCVDWGACGRGVCGAVPVHTSRATTAARRARRPRLEPRGGETVARALPSRPYRPWQAAGRPACHRAGPSYICKAQARVKTATTIEILTRSTVCLPFGTSYHFLAKNLIVKINELKTSLNTQK